LFLKRHGAEVINVLTTEFNIDIAKQVWQEEAREDGLEEGRKEGLEKGREEGCIEERIQVAVKTINQWKCTWTKAMEFAELDSEFRSEVIAKLEKQGIAYAD
jgi:predicted transposase YdaD